MDANQLPKRTLKTLDDDENLDHEEDKSEIG